MEQIPYVNYSELDEFCTVPQLAKLLRISKQELKGKCEKYGIRPRWNEVGEYGFVRYDVRKLRNALYHETRGNKKTEARHEENDPWA